MMGLIRLLEIARAALTVINSVVVNSYATNITVHHASHNPLPDRRIAFFDEAEDC